MLSESVPLRHKNRLLFENAHRQGDLLGMASATLDYNLDELRLRVLAGHDISADEIAAVTAEAESALEHTKRNGNFSWQDYYHIKSHVAFAEQCIFAQHAFEHPGEYALRGALISGAYGLGGELLQDALTQYEHADNTVVDEKELKGAINELTLPALLNRRESPSRLAMPAPIHDDKQHKKDVIYRLMVKKASFETSIQVKSSVPDNEKDATPKDGLLIVGTRDMHNYTHGPDTRKRFFTTSRLIVAELNGVATDTEIAYLDELCEWLRQKADQSATRAVIPPNLRSGNTFEISTM